MKRKIITRTVLAFATCCLVAAAAQQPVTSIDPQRHGNLAAAQDSIVQAYTRIEDAQHDNHGHLGSHAQKAKALLTQANDELRLAADTIDAGGTNAEEQQASEPQLHPPQALPLPLRCRRQHLRSLHQICQGTGPFMPITWISRAVP